MSHLPNALLAASEISSGHATEKFAIYLAAIPALGVAAQWIAWRTRLPGILLLLLFGIALGYLVRPDAVLARLFEADPSTAPNLLFPIVSLSVAVILFEGGLSLRLSELKQAGPSVFWLCTVGATVTLIGTTVAAKFLLGFNTRVSLLLGAILVVTGPTVITPMLRQIRPSRRVSSVLRWEGIVIDPIGAMLAVLVFEQLLAASAEFSFFGMVMLLGQTIGIGTLLGAAAAVVVVECLRRFWVPDHLHGIFALAIALVSFAISNMLAEESGLVAVTVMGLVMANQKLVTIEHVVELKEHLTVLLIGCLFIILGSRLEVSEILNLGLPGVLFLATVILLIRPVSVFVSTFGSILSWQERLFVSALAPRGIVAAAVASVFALKLETAGGAVEELLQARLLVPVTFLVILGTVVVYGLGSGPIARLLGLSEPDPQGVLFAGADLAARQIAGALKKLGIPVLMVDTNFNKVTAARMEELPAECVNVLNEHVKDELSLAGIGRMFAMTANDEVNSLAIREYRGLFGRAGLYQIAPRQANNASRRTLSHHLRGRVLFNKDSTFSTLEQLLENGAQIKTTSLTENHTYQDFLKRYGNDVVLICSVDEDGELLVNAEDTTLNPQPGQSIVAIVKSTPVPPTHPSQENGNGGNSSPEADKTDPPQD